MTGDSMPSEDTGNEPFTVFKIYMGTKWHKPNWTYQDWWTATTDWILMVLVEHNQVPSRTC